MGYGTAGAGTLAVTGVGVGASLYTGSGLFVVGAVLLGLGAALANSKLRRIKS